MVGPEQGIRVRKGAPVLLAVVMGKEVGQAQEAGVARLFHDLEIKGHAIQAQGTGVPAPAWQARGQAP
jgi:hypothetical protein